MFACLLACSDRWIYFALASLESKRIKLAQGVSSFFRRRRGMGLFFVHTLTYVLQSPISDLTVHALIKTDLLEAAKHCKTPKLKVFDKQCLIFTGVFLKDKKMFT